MRLRAALLSKHVNHPRLTAKFLARLYRFNFSLIVPGYGTGCAFEVPGIRTAIRDICSKSG